jgi:hypothetical protein
MILMASRSPDQRWRDIAVRTRGICFIATPHTGAAAASWVNYLKVLLRTSASVADLEAHNPHLMQLNTEFRRYVDETSLAIRVYCETRQTNGVMVVPAGTADPGLSRTEAVYLDDDHLSICKPRSRTSQLYEGIRLFVEDGFAEDSPGNPYTTRKNRDEAVPDIARGIPEATEGLATVAPNPHTTTRPSPSVAAPAPRTAGPIDRATLVRTVIGFAPGDMATFVTLIEGAARHVSRHGTVPEQAAELFGWAESSTGPGLEAIRRALEDFRRAR